MALIMCPKCGMEKEAHPTSSHMCVDCAKAINNRITYYRQHNDWLAEAAEQGLEPWLQQPGETQWEYTVWTAYRDSYPGKKPTYGDVARQLGTTYAAVRAIARRWDFTARMQLWMIECDRITMTQRRTEILDMNKDHIDMAARLRAKLSEAIDLVEPALLKPSELATLMKTAAELERKAHTDSVAQTALIQEMSVDDSNPELSKKQTKQGDLNEVIQILAKAGVLGDVAQLGIKETETKTKTTQLALMDKDGTIRSAEIEE